jgi:hypothetical protein
MTEIKAFLDTHRGGDRLMQAAGDVRSIKVMVKP